MRSWLIILKKPSGASRATVRTRPRVALALALECGIWTADRDFFGCGVAVWTTDTLAQYLTRHGG
jgi:hypothetical protein